MQRIKIATIAALVTISVGVHAIIVKWSERKRDEWTRETRVLVADEIRRQLEPLQVRVSEAHSRIDQHLAAK